MLLTALALFGLALLALAVGSVVRSRIHETVHSGGLSDADVEQILRTGEFVAEDPLDLDQVRQAEEEFWSETWDEAEEL